MAASKRITGAALCAFALLMVLICSSLACAADTESSGERALLAKHAAIKAKLDKNQFGAPIYLESTEGPDSVRVDMYGVFHYPFETVREALQSPAAWCDITSLHINIKACIYKTVKQQTQLTLYSGRKYFQPPSDAYPLKLAFRAAASHPGYLELSLVGEEGPFGTRDHRIGVQAASLEGQATFLHFSYTYSHGTMARMAIKTYFATLGHDKVGFTQVGEDGKQTYIDGVRGAVERNTMRYYLAMQTYLDTLKAPEGQRFEQRLNRWYDLTAKYPRQLKEIDKSAYLNNKKLERAQQEALQAKQGS
ncbi:hypothetical protein [Geomonas subterranea]|uniref:Uncharacterized protein n=1 Tax=Geomonas subterranea TaxID=2847989 RepID=A0ABX8LMS8_9BACT|nr:MULTISPECIES: hypothetical protein [Geomonas]QXE91934.1 hypothetical protein KP001_05210 [Geomonas subterranea]QXM09973.1 hypothetical protein KP002_02285 [Geomonas subterranea]